MADEKVQAPTQGAVQRRTFNEKDVTADEDHSAEIKQSEGLFDVKGARAEDEEVPGYHDSNADLVLSTAEDITTNLLELEDDPSLNPWTFRTFFLGRHPWSHRPEDNQHN